MATVRICDICEEGRVTGTGNPNFDTLPKFVYPNVRSGKMPPGTVAKVEITVTVSCGNSVLKDVCDDCIRKLAHQAVMRGPSINESSVSDELRQAEGRIYRGNPQSTEEGSAVPITVIPVTSFSDEIGVQSPVDAVTVSEQRRRIEP